MLDCICPCSSSITIKATSHLTFVVVVVRLLSSSYSSRTKRRYNCLASELPTSERMATRPLVLPEAYSGETSWDDLIIHFENVAVETAVAESQTDRAITEGISASLRDSSGELRGSGESSGRTIQTQESAEPLRS